MKYQNGAFWMKMSHYVPASGKWYRNESKQGKTNHIYYREHALRGITNQTEEKGTKFMMNTQISHFKTSHYKPKTTNVNWWYHNHDVALCQISQKENK